MNELKRDLPKKTTIQRAAHLVRYPNSCHVIQFLHDSENFHNNFTTWVCDTNDTQTPPLPMKSERCCLHDTTVCTHNAQPMRISVACYSYLRQHGRKSALQRKMVLLLCTLNPTQTETLTPTLSSNPRFLLVVEPLTAIRLQRGLTCFFYLKMLIKDGGLHVTDPRFTA